MEEAREGEVKVDRAEGDGLGQAEDVTVEKEKKGQEEDMNQTENEKEKPSENLKEGEEGDAEGARDRERDRERGHHHDDEEHDSQDEVLYQAFREESPIFAELCQARMDGWDDENIGRIWDKRREMLSNLDERHKSREKRNKISHVDSYYFSYRDGMTNLPSELPRHGAKVLEFGAAPGGCVKYWVEDCRAKVTAITLPVRLHGMRMSYRYSTSDVDLIEADLSVGEGYADLRDDIGASLKDWNRRLRLPEGDLFDVIHHGAIIHRGQQDVVTKEEDEQRAYRMRLTKNIYRLALFFLKPGGHLLLNLMPKLNDLLHLSLFLPLFEGFEVHRTGFRVNSRFRILLKSRREDGPIPLSVSLDGQRPWGTRLLWKFFENMTSASGREWREEPGYAEKFSNEVALAVFRRLRPALEVLWQDQINFLRWLQQRAADAKTEEELMLLAEVIAGGNAKDIDLETLFRQDQAQAEKEKALAVAGEADENTKAEAEDDREAVSKETRKDRDEREAGGERKSRVSERDNDRHREREREEDQGRPSRTSGGGSRRVEEGERGWRDEGRRDRDRDRREGARDSQWRRERDSRESREEDSFDRDSRRDWQGRDHSRRDRERDGGWRDRERDRDGWRGDHGGRDRDREGDSWSRDRGGRGGGSGGGNWRTDNRDDKDRDWGRDRDRDRGGRWRDDRGGHGDSSYHRDRDRDRDSFRGGRGGGRREWERDEDHREDRDRGGRRGEGREDEGWHHAGRGHHHGQSSTQGGR